VKKIFPRFARTDRHYPHYLRQWPYHSKNASYGPDEHTICAGLLYLCHDGWMDQEMPIPTVHVDILANFLVPETNLHRQVKDWVQKWCESHLVMCQSHILGLSFWGGPHSKWGSNRLLHLQSDLHQHVLTPKHCKYAY